MSRNIGVTGGVGCGKSRILEYLEKRGDCEVVYADLLAKELEAPGRPCYQPLVEAFGKKILNSDSTISFPALAECIFSDPGALKIANAIIHPAVEKEIATRMEQCKKPYFILEAALLLERRYDTIIPEIWYVYASEATRRERLKSSRGYSEEKISSIMASQMSEEIFRNRTTLTIDNDGSFEDTIRQVEEALKRRVG